MIRQPGELTKEWLEQVLRRRVRSFESSDSSKSSWGSHVRLSVSTIDEPHPLKLHLKIGSAATFGRDEVDYYIKYFVGLSDAPLVRCHFAGADASHYNLLLDDLSATHRDQKFIEPTESYGLALVEAAAKLHAHYWPQPPPNESLLRSAAARMLSSQYAMLEAMGESFTPAERDTARRVLGRNVQDRIARLSDPEGFTWIHRDLNPTNVLAPISGDAPVYLIDHQPFAFSPAHAWLGVSDIVHAIVVWWPIELRRQCERRLVEHWHKTLTSRGVCNYTLVKAWQDWKLCGPFCIDTPADWCSQPDERAKMRFLWEVQLKRVIAFATDHT